MLLDAGLEKKYWAEATSTAVYLINRSPSRPLYGKSPEEIWNRKQPKLSYLKTFGCIAMAHVPKEKRDKWDAKSTELLFVGYDENVKGYRLMDTRTYKIINSRDVVFFKNQFLNSKVNQEKNKNQITLTSNEPNDEDVLLQTTKSITKEESENDEFLTNHLTGCLHQKQHQKLNLSEN